MLNRNIKNILIAVSFLLSCCFISAQSALADIKIETEPTTNSAGNNGKMTITIDPTSAVSPFIISITGPLPYTFNNTTSNPVTILTSLSFGNYIGTIVDNTGCTASFATTVHKCKIMPSSGGGIPSVVCEAPSEPGPGGGVSKFYATGTVNTFVGTEPSNFTFQVFHALPPYLYEQISSYVFQTMVSEITNLAQTDYSPFEIFEQDEFQSDAPYVFSFNADGSLIWVYRNINSEGYGTMFERNRHKKPEKQSGTLFPNPTSGIVQVPIGKQVGEDEKLFYIVMNNVGQTLLSNTLTILEGMNYFTLDLGSAPSGFYFIRVANQNGESEIFTVSKL